MSSSPPSYAFADERVLLRRYAAKPDRVLEAELTDRFMPLAMSLASRYFGSTEQDDDLRQVASLGLIKALRRYDPSMGKRFVAFAAPTIQGELKRHFRDRSWRLHVPRGIQENALAVEKAAISLTEKTGRTPTAEQIATHAGLSVEAVLEALEVRESQRAVSLDVPIRFEEPSVTTLADTIGRDDQGFDRVESELAVSQCAAVSPRERQVLQLRFEEGLNQYAIAQRMGISQMQVSRILRRGLAKMLEAVQGDDAPDGRRSLEDTTPDARFPNGRTRARSPRNAPPLPKAS